MLIHLVCAHFFCIQNVFVLFNGQSLATNLIIAEAYKLT